MIVSVVSDLILIDENTYDFHGINDLRNQNPFRFTIGHFNVNSVRNKFEPLVDILMISETKIDDTFPSSLFLIGNFSAPYRLDRTAKGGEIFLYVREDILSKHIKKLHLTSHLKIFLQR